MPDMTLERGRRAPGHLGAERARVSPPRPIRRACHLGLDPDPEARRPRASGWPPGGGGARISNRLEPPHSGHQSPESTCPRRQVRLFTAHESSFVLAWLNAGARYRKKERALGEEPPTAPLPSEPCVSRALPSSLQCLLYSLFLPRPPGATLAPAVCPQWGSAIYYGCVIEMAAILQSHGWW